MISRKRDCLYFRQVRFEAIVMHTWVFLDMILHLVFELFVSFVARIISEYFTDELVLIVHIKSTSFYEL